MKHLSLILFVIVLLKSFNASGQIKTNQGTIYKFDYEILQEIKELDSVEDTITITRKRKSDITILEFSRGGTGTSVVIYDYKRFHKNIGNLIEQEYAIKISDEKSIMSGQNVLINITNQEDGLYLVQYSACNLGCDFPIRIITESAN